MGNTARVMGRQQSLPGMKPKKVKEVEEAMQRVVEIAREKKVLADQEVTARHHLNSVMLRREVRRYELDGYEAELFEGETFVRVKKSKQRKKKGKKKRRASF